MSQEATFVHALLFLSQQDVFRLGSCTWELFPQDSIVNTQQSFFSPQVSGFNPEVLAVVP